jgi:hypothetical protein
LSETTDKDKYGFRQSEEQEITIHNFSAKDTSRLNLRRDNNNELNQLREDIESYIQDLLNKLEDSLITRIETTGTGEKGDKGDRGLTGARGADGADGTDLEAGDFVDITDGVITTTYTAGTGIAISATGVISVTQPLDECA